MALGPIQITARHGRFERSFFSASDKEEIVSLNLNDMIPSRSPELSAKDSSVAACSPALNFCTGLRKDFQGWRVGTAGLFAEHTSAAFPSSQSH